MALWGSICRVGLQSKNGRDDYSAPLGENKPAGFLGRSWGRGGFLTANRHPCHFPLQQCSRQIARASLTAAPVLRSLSVITSFPKTDQGYALDPRGKEDKIKDLTFWPSGNR
jgi:hypothetical protein